MVCTISGIKVTKKMISPVRDAAEIILSHHITCLSSHLGWKRRCISTDDDGMFIARQRKSQCQWPVIDAFWQSCELFSKACLMAKPTPASRFFSLLWFPLPLLSKSHLEQLSLSRIGQFIFQQKLFYAGVYLIQHCPSAYGMR